MKGSVILILLVVLSLGVSAQLSLPDGPVALGEGSNIQVSIVNQEPDPVSPGENLKLRVKIENIGSKQVEGVVLEILPGFGYKISDNPQRNLGTLLGGQIGSSAQVVSFNLIIDSTTPEGLLEIKFSQTSDDQQFPVIFSLFPTVQTSADNLVVSSIKTDPVDMGPGTRSTLQINLTNIGDSIIKDVRVNLDLTGLDFSVLYTTNELIIPFVTAKSTAAAEFSIIPDPNIDLGLYKIPVTIDFENSQGTRFSKNLIAGIAVNEVPKYLLSLDRSDVYTKDERGIATVTLSNVGNGIMKFVTLELLPSDNYDVLSARQVYIGNIESDDLQSSDFEVFVNEKGDIPLKFKLSYEDIYNNEFSDTVSVNLPILTGSKASRLGLKPATNPISLILGFSIGIIFLVFWLAMIWDVHKRKMHKTKRWIWYVVVILGTIPGAIVYYFIRKSI